MIALAWTGASMWVIPILGWNYILFAGQRQQQQQTGASHWDPSQ